MKYIEMNYMSENHALILNNDRNLRKDTHYENRTGIRRP